MVDVLIAGLILTQWVNIPDSKPNLSAPAPRAADGKPDLSGVWMANDHAKLFRNMATDLKQEAPFQPWARDLQKLRVAREHGDDPLARCLPHGVPRIGTSGVHPFKIIQTPKLVAILYEQLTIFRQIFLDGRSPLKDPNPTWLGYSTGKWEDDVLVVDTTGFNGQSWLDTTMGHPSSDALHVIERFRRKNFGGLEIRITIDDPKAYTKTWDAVEDLHLLPDSELIEYICNENEKDQPHMNK